jgi:acetyl esterase/lipase
MLLSAKFVRSQLNKMKHLLNTSSLEAARKSQDFVGEILSSTHRKEVTFREHEFEKFIGSWAIPKDEIARGAILYLHGGGYTCGDIEYAKGFGSVLAAECGVKVFCPAYRLAPENKYPAALDDALTSYEYLLSKGYEHNHIVICGESAGGGLAYSLCLKLKDTQRPLPAGIIAISPWTDLTSSGNSYEKNRDVDPSMTSERLKFFAECYTDDPIDPYVSPLFGNLRGMPPSLIFVGGDEIMLDDARLLHKNLLENGCKSQLVTAAGMWHAYVLYCLKEYQADIDTINLFLKTVLKSQRKLRWMRLDNAAKIYPAARRRNWSNIFRLSATLSEPIDKIVLQSALDVTVRRFPSISVRLRRGIFWYYLEEIPKAPSIMKEKSYPLARMPFDDIRKCAFRILLYKNRIALEFFHAVTDGTGGLIFLKTLLAEYLTQKHGIKIPPVSGVLDRLMDPSPEELEDSFLTYSGKYSYGRGEETAYKIVGIPESGDFKYVTTLMLESDEVLRKAAGQGVSLTSYITAAMMKAILNMQAADVKDPLRRKPVKICVPVNLRRLFPSKTLRNFALFTTPGVDPRLGEYSFEELCKSVHYQLNLDVTAKRMRAKFSANVNSEKSLILKIMPLFIKNIAMKLVFNAVGEKKSCLCLSNLGDIKLPEKMYPYITRMDFVLGVQSNAPYNCGVLSYGGTLYMNFIRDIKDPVLERHFFEVVKSLGLKAKVESNWR